MIPRFLQGILILFWGLQTDLIWFALPMAIIAEARFIFNRRWALTQQDFYRVADLTTVALLGTVLFLFLNARTYHFIITLFQWLPLLFFPLTTVTAYSTTKTISLDVLFYSLRRQKAPVDQSLDMDYFSLGLYLLAIGTNVDDYSLYFPLCALVILISLFPLRSTRYRTNIWLLLALLSFLFANLTHLGLRQSHLALKARSEQWIANWLAQRTDPLRTTTALGKVGQLKLIDKIIFRVKPDTPGQIPGLLHEASYDLPEKRSLVQWSVMERAFDEVSHHDDFTWRFAAQSNTEKSITIYKEFDSERSLIPIPTSLTEVHNLPALELRKNRYGAIQASGLVPSPSFEIRYDPTSNGSLFAPPGEIDTYIPDDYKPLMSEVVSQQHYSGAEAIAFIQNYFKDFRYSLFQKNRPVNTDPLSHFLLDRKAGHCEYFATATTLMLRQMGIPARYVLGYSVQEYNSTLEMYIVRQRHAHTWTIAYINDQWHVVDTTPSSWFGMEQDNADLLQPLFDFLGNYGFMFSLWWNQQQIEDYELELFVMGAILLLILIWRISRSEQVILTNNNIDITHRQFPGIDSPFYKIETYLLAKGRSRSRGELLRDWVMRIQEPELLPLLPLHNRWRFDPQGISRPEKKLLHQKVSDWLADQDHEEFTPGQDKS